MLIIVTGSDGIGKRQIARDISTSLNNNFEFNGFEIKYTHSIDGNVRFSLLKNGVDINTLEKTDDGLPVDLITEESVDEYREAIAAADDNYDNVLGNATTVQHIWDSHCDPDFDYNIVASHKAIDAPNTMLHSTDVVEMYNNKIDEHVIVSGLFSKYYIDFIISELGATNVKVINIIRHPSVSYLLDFKAPEFYESDTKPDLTPAENKQKFMESILVAASLQDVDYIETIKFEDMLVNGLTVLGIKITQGEGYNNYNGLLSVYEQANHEVQDLTEFNREMATYNPLFWDPDLSVDDNDEYASLSDYIEALEANIPTDLFDLYPDYTALDYDTILSEP